MSRRRYVGKQAAADNDILTLGVLNAALATLPGIYLELSRLNQPSGVPQLDANSRMQNQFLPSDISQTTLTASGKATAGSAEVKGVLNAVSLALGTPTTPGGPVTGVTNLTASGALSAASAVLSGSVKAATADIPEITSASLKAKALVVDSINNPGGGLTVSALVSQGSIAAVLDSTANRDMQAIRNVLAGNNVQATETVQGKNVIASANVGSSTLSTTGKATLNNAEVTNALTVNGALNPVGGVQALGQPDVISWLDQRLAAVEAAAGAAAADVPWLTLTLNTNVTSPTADPIRYRVITENGRQKVQFRGRVGVISSSATLWTMPANARPALDLSPIVVGRDLAGGGLTALIEVKASGLVNLTGHTVGVNQASGALSGGSGSTSTVDPNDNTTSTSTQHAHFSSDGPPPSSTTWTTGTINNVSSEGVAHSHGVSGSHAHTVPAHVHGLAAITAPTLVSFTGVEYFL